MQILDVSLDVQVKDAKVGVDEASHHPEHPRFYWFWYFVGGERVAN